MFKVLIQYLEFLLKKDVPFIPDENYKQNLELYKLHRRQASFYYKQVHKKHLKNLLIHHKHRILRTFVTGSFIFVSLYFIIINFYPKITHIFVPSNLEATINNDSLIKIKNIVNPNLTAYLDAIAATESPVVDANRNGILDFEDTLKAYSRRCFDPSSSAIGRYQMTNAARQSVGLGGISDEVFLNWPELQDIACYKFLQKNYQAMKPFIKKYEGQTVNGYYLTETGMISLAHALGAGGAMSWINNGCKPNQLPAGAPHSDRRLTFQRYRITFR